MNTSRKRLTSAAAFAGLVLLAGCDVKVDKGEGDEPKDVDVRTPLGDLSVRTNVNAADTGLPVYPGAQPVRGDDEQVESADVNIGTSFFGMRVVAAKFESGDAPEAIVDFYKDKMKTYGDVLECRGDIDFQEASGSQRPVCRENGASHEIQLATGTEERHRLVSVKQRGSGSEFAVVYFQTRE